jgi:hypothetical protein
MRAMTTTLRCFGASILLTIWACNTSVGATSPNTCNKIAQTSLQSQLAVNASILVAAVNTLEFLDQKDVARARSSLKNQMKLSIRIMKSLLPHAASPKSPLVTTGMESAERYLSEHSQE